MEISEVEHYLAKKTFMLKKTELYIILGCGLFCILSWADEILDLPHLLMGAPQTPLNWYEVVIETIFIATVCFLIVANAIRRATEHKKTKDALRETRDYLESLINFANAPIIVWNPAFKINRFNHAFEHLTGYTADEVIGQKLSMLFPEASRDESLSKIKRTLRGEHWESVEIPILCKNGEVRLVLWNSANIYAEDNATVVATIAQGQDITERKKAQEEVRGAQQKLIEQHRHERERAEAELAKVSDELVRTTRLATIGQVSASIAHDLRNPLGAMRNASYFLRRHLSKDELKAPEHLDIIEQEVVKADQIITNLLEMARPKTPHKQEIDLGETVKDVFSHAKRAEGVRCRTSLVPDPFVVRADPNQLRQMIGNIVDNAVDAMKGQGEIFVEATHDSDYDTLVFRDTGPGIAPEVRERLFEPLVTTKASGTGLGLMICHQIVEKHGGTIGAENCEGCGAAIRVRLPR